MSMKLLTEREGLPRARGDGPPRTRGWTLTVALVSMRITGFPAHAGMDLW